MRLFTAILFDDTTNDYIVEIMDRLKLQTTKGSYTLRENLHLTLNFIGETNRKELVEDAMRQAVRLVHPGPIHLRIGGFGRFQRREGDICYIPVEKEALLWKLQKQLVIKLKENGFDVDDLEYKPHLTLVRKAIFRESFDGRAFGESVPVIDRKANEICLMKSERIHGKLVYTKISEIPLLN